MSHWVQKKKCYFSIGLVLGPHELKYINPFLQPLVEELLKLWNETKFSICPFAHQQVLGMNM